MKIFVIAWKDIKIRFKDIKGIVLMLLLPIILTAILGLSLKGVLNDESTSMPKMTIAVFNADQGEMGKSLVEDVLQNEQLASYITVHMFTTYDEVQSQVLEGIDDIGIVIPHDFSQNVTALQETQLEILENQGKSMIAQIVGSIISSYAERVSAVAQVSKETFTQLTHALPASALAEVDFNRLGQEIADQIGSTALTANNYAVDQPIGPKAVSSMQYYAAAMAVMFLLFNATVGAKMIINERSTETLARLLNTPTSKTTILLGKYVGTLAFSLLQLFFFMAATYFAFGVSWGDNIVQSVVIGLMYAISVSGLSMAVAAMITNEQTVDTVSGLGVQILSALGGSMVPLAVFPEILRKLALITPNTWALNSFTDIMGGTTWQALLLPITVLFAIGAGSLLLGTWRLRYR